ncbi:MAG: helix-turn-helix domain-containing protein [Candidatus Binatia bacterium]
MSTLSEQLRNAIRESGMSLHDLSNEVGISGGILSRFMRAERSMTLETAEKLCAFFGLELSPVRKGRR